MCKSLKCFFKIVFALSVSLFYLYVLTLFHFLARSLAQTLRLLNIHRNVPGVLRGINTVLADYNVSAQVCAHAFVARA